MNRRDFLSQAAVVAVPLLRPNVPDRQTGNRWREEGGHPGTWFILDFGIGETHVFTPGDKIRWHIRCGSFHRELFEGTAEQAKKEAERFTRSTLQNAVVVLESL